jgi:glutamine synthetase
MPLETQNPAPLPTTLADALAQLERSTAAADWLGEDLLAAYLLFKRAEIKGLDGLDENEICRRYAEVY